MSTETTTLTAQELALYLGCEVQTPEGKGKLSGINPVVAIIEYGIMGPDYVHRWHFEFIKPLLRPISDITEDEVYQLNLNGNQTAFDITGWRKLTHIHLRNFNPTQFQLLLSYGFDLFGYIEEVKAIDKTKTK